MESVEFHDGRIEYEPQETTGSTIESLFQLVRSQTGMQVSLSDFSGMFDTFPELRAAPWLRRHGSPLCDLTKSTHRGAEVCVAQKGRVASLLQSRRRSTCGTCPWGLTEVVEPVLHRGMFIGAVFYGPFVLLERESLSRDRLETACAQKRLALPLYQAAWQVVPRVAQADLPRLRREAALLRRTVEDIVSVWNVPLPTRVEPTAYGEPVSHAAPELVLRALHLIHARPVDRHSVTSMAARLGCHPNHLGQVFLRAIGRRLQTYVSERRIDRAKLLLISGRYTVSQTSDACGFQDTSHFCRVFRQITGQTPAQFRKTARAKPT